MGSLHANFDQNRPNVKKFAKKWGFKANRTKDQYLYMQNNTLYKMVISKFQNFEILAQKFHKTDFREKSLSNPMF